MGCLSSTAAIASRNKAEVPESLLAASGPAARRVTGGGAAVRLDNSDLTGGGSNLFTRGTVDSLRTEVDSTVGGSGTTAATAAARGGAPNGPVTAAVVAANAKMGHSTSASTDAAGTPSSRGNGRKGTDKSAGSGSTAAATAYAKAGTAAAATVRARGRASSQTSQKAHKTERPRDTPESLSKASSVIAKTTFAADYAMGKIIGSGNYSEVYQATERRSGLVVAVKVTNKVGQDTDDVREIKEEVSILAELRHPNVIELHAFYEDVENFFMVTEFMGGGELFDEIVEREFYWERDAQEVVRMLADALHFMHKRGVAHRDLKPENILLTSKGRDGVVKLADFGFAARFDPTNVAPQLYTACGTPAYVSPEIIKGLPYGPETDIWSLGVITFVLLSGYPPFHDEDVHELFRLIRRGKVAFDPNYWSLVSEEAKACVKMMLSMDPKTRPSADAVLRHPWLAKLAPPVAVVVEPPAPTDGSSRTVGAPGASAVVEIDVDSAVLEPVLGTAAAAAPAVSARTLPAAPSTAQFSAGVAGRGLGEEGRGPPGSRNITPAIPELRKFQARRRWKNDMVMALIREGQMFGVLDGQDVEELLSDDVGQAGAGDKKKGREESTFTLENLDDFTKLGGLGSSDVLNRLQSEKRAASARLPGGAYAKIQAAAAAAGGGGGGGGGGNGGTSPRPEGSTGSR